MRIGFKTSKHTGQQFLTFKPRIVGFPVYSYTLGGKPYTPKSGQSIKAFGEYADYGDFLNFSEALTTYPVVADAKKIKEGRWWSSKRRWFAAELDKMMAGIPSGS